MTSSSILTCRRRVRSQVQRHGGKPSWVSPGSGDWPCGIEHVNDHDASCWYGIAYIVNIASLCIWGVYYVYEILYSIYSTCVHHVHHGRFTHRASRLNVNFHIVFPYVSQAQDSLGSSPASTKINLWSSKTAMARYTEKKNAVIFHSKLLDSQRVTAFDMLKWRVLCWNLAHQWQRIPEGWNSVKFLTVALLISLHDPHIVSNWNISCSCLCREYISWLVVWNVFYVPIYWE